MRGIAWNVLWTGIQTLLAVLVPFVSERHVTTADLVTALILAVAGTALFLGATHPKLWRRNPAAVPRYEGAVREIYAGVSWSVAPENGEPFIAGPFCPVDGSPLHYWIDPFGTFYRDVVQDGDHMSLLSRLKCPDCGKTYGIDSRIWPGRTVGQLKYELAQRVKHRRLPRSTRAH